jgi:hypothetical protein
MNHELKRDLYNLYYTSQSNAIKEILRLLKASNVNYNKAHYEKVYDFFYNEDSSSKELSDIIFIVEDLIDSVK